VPFCTRVFGFATGVAGCTFGAARRAGECPPPLERTTTTISATAATAAAALIATTVDPRFMTSSF
jgi:hypothetical protein